MTIKAQFITFEGIDGCGKSTQLSVVSELLTQKDIRHICLSEPGSTVLGLKIRELILSDFSRDLSLQSQMLLFMACRAELIEKKIKPALANGNWVLCDRFLDSTVAYQGVKNIRPKFIEAIQHKLFNSCLPNLTFWLKVPTSQSIARIKSRKVFDDFEQRHIDLMTDIDNNYQYLAQKYSDRIKVIDGSQSIESVATSIKQQVLRIIDNEQLTMNN